MPKSIKPHALKTAVIAKAIAGETNTQIAQDLEMSRNTVAKILAEGEFEQIMAETKASTLRLLPKAVAHAERELDSDKPGTGLRMLEGVGILGKQDHLQTSQPIAITVVVQSVANLGSST